MDFVATGQFGYTLSFDEVVNGTIDSSGNLNSLLHEWGLLVIKAFPLDDEEFVWFFKRFGEPELVSPPQFSAPGYPEIRIQSNVPGVGVQGGGEYWHSDGPWSEQPSPATLLLCFQAPEEGGQTLFVDMRAALDALPDDLRQAIEGRYGCYPCRDIYGRELEGLGMDDPVRMAMLRDLRHPLIRAHPVTGRKALYLNEKWLTGIEGMPPAEGERLLMRLYQTATQPARIYAHHWVSGDLLVWDNASVMHKALPALGNAVKTTHRITIRASAEATSKSR